MNITFAFYVAAVYFIMKIVDYKYVSKTDVNSKSLGKNSLIVFLSTIAASFVNEKLNPVLEAKNIQVFTTEPKF